MKKFLLFSFSLFFGLSTLNAQCDPPTSASPLVYCGGVATIPLEAAPIPVAVTYTLNMTDVWGDGWNGNEISIFADGELVLPNAAITSGYSGSETFSFLPGATLTATWFSPPFSYPSEVGFNIVDENGTNVSSGGVGSTIDYTTPSVTYTLNWYDAVGGTLLGSGSQFESVGSTVMPTANTGSYSFFVTSTSNNCTESAALELVVDVTDVTLDLTPIDETCIGYANGSFDLGLVSCGTAPFTYDVDGGGFGAIPTDLTAGTYTVTVKDDNGLESAPISVVIGTTYTDLPAAPVASTTVYNICGGLSDFDITATAPPSSTTLIQNTSLGTNLISTGDGISTFPVIIPALPAGATIVSAQLELTDVNSINGSWRSEIRVGLSGINTLAPTQISTLNSSGLIFPDPAPINLIGFPSTGGTLNLLLSETYNDFGDDAIYGNVNLVITYAMPADINWYDASTAGTQLGTGSPFDCIGNSVMANPSSNGSYDFYASSMDGVCESATRTLVTVDVVNVEVGIEGQDVSCIGNADGTFAITTVSCGTPPFSFSVDGGAFGPAPTDLAAGTYSVVVEDGASLQSGVISVTVGTPPTVIPGPPTGNALQTFCSGSASILLEATSLPELNENGELTYTLNMTDSYGDGWNGNQISIYADGELLLPNATITSGASGSETFSFLPGATLTATWVTGSYQYEVGFNIEDENGTIVFEAPSGAFGSTGGVGSTIDYTTPNEVGLYTLNWYDAASGGNLEGNGSPFEAVGTGVMPTAETGVYDFFVTQQLEGCESSALQVSVEIFDLLVTLSTTDETCTDYSNGGFAILDTLCGQEPFEFSVDGGTFGPAPSLTAGTYSIVVRDADSLFSAPITIEINTLETSIPPSPIADSLINACIDDISVELTAVGDISATDSLLTTMQGGNGANANMFVIEAIQETTIQNFAWNMNQGSAGDVSVYYREDNYLTVPGANTSNEGWILLGTAEGLASDGPDYTNIPVPVNITIPAGESYSFHLSSTGSVTYTNGTGLGNIWAATSGFSFIEGHGGSLFNCTFAPRIFNGLIRYESTEAIDVAWFDAATGGAVIGNGSPFESIGTAILPDASTAGSYDFYVASDNNGCYSEETVTVTVNVSPVNVYLSSVDATCNTGSDGSFAIDSVDCGAVPYSFIVDGGAAGPAPTDLSPGTYEITVVDGNSDSSYVYYLTVGSAAGPTDLVINDLTDNSVEVSWNANGSETSWIIEYGEPGFTPDTGTESGTVTVSDTVVVLTGLDGNTSYDFYVAADCGTTPGDWGTISFTTDCGIYTLPFEETFENNSATRVCWYNINEVGTDVWTYQTGSSGGGVNTAFEGDLNARFVSSFTPSTSKLASPRIDVSNQDSVALVFAYAQEVWFGDQNITKVYKRASDTLPWIEIASYNVNTPEWTLDTLYVADSSDQLEIAFEGINAFGYANVVDAVEVLPCSLEPGIDGSDNVCRAVEAVDLNSFITAGEDFGTWSFPANESFVTGSIASVQFLPEGTHDFYYIVSTPCAADTTIATLIIYGPSSAGNDGADTVCMNEPYNLLSSLSGSIDLGGEWIDPTGASLSSPSITGSSIPGSYNYQYVTSNGVCDGDTSTVLLFVNPDCDYLGLMETDLGFFELYPNPTNGVFSIRANDAEGFFSVEITDLNGRMVSTLKNFITANEIKSVDLSSSENGVYFVKIYNNNVFKTYRVVKN